MKELLEYDTTKLIKNLWECDPEIYSILKSSDALQDARNKLFDYLNDIERHLYDIYSDKPLRNMNLLEKNNVKECIRVFKNVVRTKNEMISDFSALSLLCKAANKEIKPDQLNEGFLLEFIFLSKGINGNSGLYTEKDVPLFLKLSGREAALERTKSLDGYASNMEIFFRRYKTGLDKDLMEERKRNKEFIQDFFNASEPEWQNYNWHIENIIMDISTLQSIVKLSNNELKGLEYAKKYNIPFQITPYYLSLFDRENKGKYDHTIRAQVLPSETYCLNYIQSKESGSMLDFMDEKSTSLINGITRRYPQILILKPFDSNNWRRPAHLGRCSYRMAAV